MASQTFRIGTGAGFSADRLEPAVDLVKRGNLDVLVLECLGERTVAFAHRDRMADPSKGYNTLLDRRMRALLPACRAAGTTIITMANTATMTTMRTTTTKSEIRDMRDPRDGRDWQ